MKRILLLAVLSAGMMQAGVPVRGRLIGPPKPVRVVLPEAPVLPPDLPWVPIFPLLWWFWF